MKLKISQKDARLLMLLFSLIIVGVSYFLVYVKNEEQTNQFITENEELKQRINTLKEKVSKREEIEVDTQRMRTEMEGSFEVFPSKLTREKVIYILVNMEEQTGMEIKSIEFNMEKPLLSENEDNDNSQEETSAELEELKVTEEARGDGVVTQVYVSTISLTYSASYDELKKAVDYLNGYSDKIGISKISGTINRESGELNGIFEIAMYSADGTKKEYVPPVVPGSDGKGSNLFQ